MAAIQPGSLGHRKRTAPTTGRLASGRPVPSTQTKVHASHGDVSALQQQSVHALAQPTEQAPAQNHHRFLQRHERRTSSLCHSLPPCPPSKLPNHFVNWPWVGRDLERICLRCLEKSPERRYAEAATLAE